MAARASLSARLDVLRANRANLAARAREAAASKEKEEQGKRRPLSARGDGGSEPPSNGGGGNGAGGGKEPPRAANDNNRNGVPPRVAANDNARASQSRILISPDGRSHVLDRHTKGGSSSTGKSIFRDDEDVDGLIQKAASVPAARQKNGNYQRIVNAGRPIGTDALNGGKETKMYTVITSSTGELITAHPGLPSVINLSD